MNLDIVNVLTSDQSMILANQFMRKTDRDNYNLRNLYRDVSGKNFGVNKGSPAYNVDVGGNVNCTTDYFLNGYLLVPTGTIMPFAGSNTSNLGHWLFCDGSSISQTTYSALFAVIGTTYGVIDTSGADADMFYLPDLRGKMPLGAGQGSGLTNRLLGDASGQENITEVPPHTHDISDIGHTHSINNETVQNTCVGTDAILASVDQNIIPDNSSNGVTSEKTGITILDEGDNISNTAVDIMNPYLVINFIIKY